MQFEGNKIREHGLLEFPENDWHQQTALTHTLPKIRSSSIVEPVSENLENQFHSKHVDKNIITKQNVRITRITKTDQKITKVRQIHFNEKITEMK